MSGADAGKFSEIGAAFRAAGVSLDPRAADALVRYAALLARWNRRINLTAVREPLGVAETHMLDSSLVASDLGSRERLVDVGAGAGFPGLVVAILRPDVRVTLVEPAAKKVAFLRAVVDETGAANVEVVRARDDRLPDGGWDRAVSRATMEPPRWLAAGMRLVRSGGAVGLMVADEAKLPRAPEGMKRKAVLRLTLPSSGATRVLAWYVRTL